MQLIGLTGGIASGKSTIASRLAELGAVVVDADRIAREIVEPGTPALAEIRRAFGDGVIAPDGGLDRPALGSIVFGDPAALQILNGITHPAVLRESTARFEAAAAADPDAIVVYDVPLLVESANRYPFDLVVVAHADAATRARRLVELRGMDAAEAERRIGSQASDAERLSAADHVIHTGGTLEETRRQVDALWGRLRG
ncbi:dephospho-CoA kinase [Leifsonia xyli subsp. cynodontis DSM 46306]|uniref:Dephospho-CoA kinase n=1 Tax=Leifsonia xyli subsp. cynodontis DSM 46306 TaxID=1389489 RepID=U3PCT7_LEIXC|nr:dephospho-CoA kinase [Leifsonia xyli]AGW41333.1 dephospho-CoA kinase [Leifsonia xyli subsp. cynodontis DSM 46306]